VLVSFLSRAFAVPPRHPHAVRVQRDLVISAGAGVPLLTNRFLDQSAHLAGLY
jgi:hypothetical protein